LRYAQGPSSVSLWTRWRGLITLSGRLRSAACECLHDVYGSVPTGTESYTNLGVFQEARRGRDLQ